MKESSESGMLRQLLKDLVTISSKEDALTIRNKWDNVPGIYDLVKNHSPIFKTFGIQSTYFPDEPKSIHLITSHGFNIFFYPEDRVNA